MTKYSDHDKALVGTRRLVLKGMTMGAIAAGTTLAGVVGDGVLGAAKAATGPLKFVFVQYQPHTVSAAWGKGIQEVLDIQPGATFQLLDGQAKADVQISLIETAINDGASVIFIQPVDSVAVAPVIKKAKKAGIPVISLNIDSTEPHAAHVEMNHYFGGGLFR